MDSLPFGTSRFDDMLKLDGHMQLVRTEYAHAHEAKLIFLVSGRTMEAKVLVQLIWLKNKGGRILGGGRIFEKLRYKQPFWSSSRRLNNFKIIIQLSNHF